MKKNSLIFVIIFIVICTYVVMHTVRFFTDGYHTETPYIFTVTNTYATNGIIIRDEIEIPTQVGENVIYVVDEGAKVLPDTKVAREYDSNDDRRKAQEILNKNKMIEKLKGLSDISKNSNIALLTNDIMLQLSKLAKSKAENSFHNISDVSLDLLISLAEANLAIGKSTDIKLPKIEDTGPSYKSYSTGTRGIFSSYVDGYEKLLNPKAIQSINFETLDKLLNIDYKKTSSLGKILKNINWYYISEVDYDVGRIFQSAGSLLMTFPGSDDNGLYGKLVHAVEDKKAQKTLIVVSSRDISADALGNRKPQINFAFPNYRGIRFSKDALRIVDGKRGVYVMGNSTIKFKTVDIIYTGEDFYLSKENYSLKSDALSVFDEVIVRGKNLYDGKVLE